MLFVLLLLVVWVHRSSAPWSYPTPARVAEHMEFPWQAVILRKPTVSTYGGIIASAFYVLSLCKNPNLFYDLKNEITYSNFRVVAGSISVRPYEFQGAQVRWMYYWEDHPRCRRGGDATYKHYDISVIKVTQMFVFNSYLKPMPFERDQAKMKRIVDGWLTSNKTCTFAGFGGYRYINITAYLHFDSGHELMTVEQYTPSTPTDDPDCCISTLSRVIDMTLVDYPECLRTPGWIQNHHKIYLNDPPVDSLCAIGSGHNGSVNEMNRSGMLCDLDFGGPLQCKREDGNEAGQYLVIGHASFGYLCRFRFADLPGVFTRYDWALHEWIMQFYNPKQFGDHWVDAVYEVQLVYSNRSVYTGPIPPEDIS